MAHSQVHYSQRTKPLIKLIEQLASRHSSWQVFSDFLLLSACSISNAVDPVHRDEREKQYMEAIKRYKHDEIQVFPQMLEELMKAMQWCAEEERLEDILGKVFHELELHNKYHGQFFTPQNLAEMIGVIAAGEQRSDDKPYETVCEPCIGSGAMVMGLINAMRKNNALPVVVTGVDVDLKCVHMAYIQLSLYGIPAVIIHGNTLTCEEWSRWYTPIYVAEKWVWRQPCGITNKPSKDDEMLKLATEPMYAAMRSIELLLQSDRPAESEKAAQSAPVPMVLLREDRNGQTSLF